MRSICAPRLEPIVRSSFAWLMMPWVGIWGAVACRDEGSEAPGPSQETRGDASIGADAATTTSNRAQSDAYCGHLCGRSKECDDDFDRQTCERECKSQSGVIGNLNPDLVRGLYECVDNTSCSTIGTQRFVAACLAEASRGLEPNSSTRGFCRELETAADECSYTDYDKQGCWKVSIVYTEAVLASAVICAKKECDLIVNCLDATLKVPMEPDGSPIGFDSTELSSGVAALPATAAIFPKTAATDHSQPGPNATNDVFSTSDDPNGDSAQVSTESLLPIPVTPQPPGLDITDPAVQKEYCAADDGCTDCSLSACCTELLTCLTNDACVDWVSCVSACPESNAGCERECRTTHTSGEDAALDYLSCFDDATTGACANACAEPNPSDTSSDATSTAATVNSDNEISTALDTTALDTTADTTRSGDDSSNPVVSTCGDCLVESCAPFFEACFDDPNCTNLYYLYAACLEAHTLAVEVNDCIAPHLDIYDRYFPDGTFKFYAMNECLATADCPVCDG